MLFCLLKKKVEQEKEGEGKISLHISNLIGPELGSKNTLGSVTVANHESNNPTTQFNLDLNCSSLLYHWECSNPFTKLLPFHRWGLCSPGVVGISLGPYSGLRSTTDLQHLRFLGFIIYKTALTDQPLKPCSCLSFLAEYICRYHLHTHIWVYSTKTHLGTLGNSRSDRGQDEQAEGGKGARRTAYRKNSHKL